jgi:hypothetical protein
MQTSKHYCLNHCALCILVLSTIPYCINCNNQIRNKCKERGVQVCRCSRFKLCSYRKHTKQVNRKERYRTKAEIVTPSLLVVKYLFPFNILCFLTIRLLFSTVLPPNVLPLVLCVALYCSFSPLCCVCYYHPVQSWAEL